MANNFGNTQGQKVDYTQFPLDWSKAKQGTFSGEERETVIVVDDDSTSITTSQIKIINKVIKQYSDAYTVRVMYYGISSSDGSKYPTEIIVTVPSTKLITLRSLS